MSLPLPAEVDARLAAILARGSVNLGAGAGCERLMLMLTRSCELRCVYCMVDKTETGPQMSRETARRSIDLLMRSRRPRLELQLFGGEPTRRWEVLEDVVRYAIGHPARDGRRLEIVLTTNGIALDVGRLARLAAWPLTVLFSVDGDAAVHARLRPGLDRDARYDAIDRAIDALLALPVSWFANVTLPPAAAEDGLDRLRWAQARGVPRMQLNYAVGMRWAPAQEQAYLLGLQEVLDAHRARPQGLLLYNWDSACEPVMLSDDLIVDTDGAILHDGAVFLERALPALKTTYRRGHIDDDAEFDPLRWSLQELHDAMLGTWAAGSPEHALALQNIRMGAAVDLVIARARAAGRP